LYLPGLRLHFPARYTNLPARLSIVLCTIYSAKSLPPRTAAAGVLNAGDHGHWQLRQQALSRGPTRAPSVAALSLSSHLLCSCRLGTPKAGHHLGTRRDAPPPPLEEGEHARARVGERKQRRARRGVYRHAPRSATWCTRRSRREGVVGRVDVVVIALCQSRAASLPCLMSTATRHRGRRRAARSS